LYNILICDDDRDIVAALKIYLSGRDYTLFEGYNGEEAIDVVRNHDIHLILMDIMMPKMDGISATAALRRESNVPIILLTAKSECSDKVLGLDIGADDYITKPFDAVEVLARVKSQLRRYTMLGSKTETSSPGTYATGGISLNEITKSVTVDGVPVTLTPLEFQILNLLIKNPGRIYSSEQIYESVWKEESIGSERSVAVHIRHLRQKIEANPSDPRYLKVVWGLGYKMEEQGYGRH
jgi:DNA-binding response OmpR family regulator